MASSNTPIEVKASIDAVEKARCEYSLANFVRLAWHVVEPGNPYIEGWHIDYICRHLEAITEGVEIDGKPYNRLLINVPPGMMKAIQADEPVLTTFGWKRHSDVRPGDFVYGPDGLPKRVIAENKEKTEEGFRLEFDDGTSIVAGAAHEWVIERDLMDATTGWRRVKKRMTVETRNLIYGTRPDRIIVADPISSPPLNLLVDPYVLGAWLGDGGSDAGSIYAAEQDIKHFEKLGRIGSTVPGGARGQPFHRITVEGLQVKLRVLGLLKNKHVPDDYMYSSKEQRLALLQGLMDTDGNITKEGTCIFWNKNKQIADSVAYIVNSLGSKASVTSRFTILNGKKYGPHYKVTFRPNNGMVPFRLDRKADRVTSTRNSRTTSRYIKNIIPVGPQLLKCIQVEGGVYLVGKQLCPTHNSLLVTVFWPAWEWGPRNMPHMRYLCASHSVNLAIRDSVRMRRLVSSEWYQRLWGNRVQLADDQNAKGKFENSATGFREATASGSITGSRADRVLIDDPHSVESAASEAMRNTTIEWFTEAVPSRMNNPVKSAIVVIMQRLHEEDVSGIILERKGFRGTYDHIMLPMEYDTRPGRPNVTKLGYSDVRTEEGELLFPERFPAEVVAQLKGELGPFAAAGQLQQEPVPRGGGIIKDEWWTLWVDEAFPPLEYVIGVVDTAYTEKEENDYSAMTVWGVFSVGSGTAQAATRSMTRYGTPQQLERSYGDGSQQVIMLHAWQAKLAFPDLVKRVAKEAKDFKIDTVLIEDKAAGISLSQELRRSFRTESFGVILAKPKGLDKASRLYSVQHLFADGIIWAPDKEWAEEVIRQVASFPKGKHDDLCFAAGTMIATKRGPVPIEAVTNEDWALTPIGWKKVLASAQTGVKNVVTRGPLVGTPGHPIFTLDLLYQPLETVSTASKTVGLGLCDLMKTMRLRKLFLKASSTGAWAANGDIISASPAAMRDGDERKAFMSPFGKATMASRSLQGMTSIIETMTCLILSLRIWSAYRLASTGACLRSILTGKRSALTSQNKGLWRRYGINLRKAALGIARSPLNLLSKLGKSLRPSPREIADQSLGLAYAIGAGHHTNIEMPQNVAVAKAAPKIDQIIWEEGGHRPTDISCPVYNLTVDEAHCYYANGILVHNCDTVAYALRYLRESGLLQRAPERMAELEEGMRFKGRAAPALYNV